MSKKLDKYTPTKNYSSKMSLDKLNQMFIILFKKGGHNTYSRNIKKILYYDNRSKKFEK